MHTEFSPGRRARLLALLLSIGTLAGCGGASWSGDDERFRVGGYVSNLRGTGLVLLLNNQYRAHVAPQSGTEVGFQFEFGIQSGRTYNVAVSVQPTEPAQNCIVDNHSGTIAGADVSDVTVTCETLETGDVSIGGTVSGLAGDGLVLIDAPTGDTVAIAADGDYVFPNRLVQGDSYSVSVYSQPAGQACRVQNYAGVAATDVTDINVSCSATRYSVGGTLQGIESSRGVQLRNNGTDWVTVNANGPFHFPGTLTTGAGYHVTLDAGPSGQDCTITGGSGTIGTSNVTSVLVSCAPASYHVGGTVSGLLGAGLTLRHTHSGGSEELVITADGTFTFPTELPVDGDYAVTVVQQPVDPTQSCIVNNGSGQVGTADVTSVEVVCSTESFTVGGAVSGLAGGEQVVLELNGGSDLTVQQNGSFVFDSSLPDGSDYTVTVATHPAGKGCAVTGGEGVVSGAAVTDVAVSCETGPFTIGGTVHGLSGSGLVLRNNGEHITVSADGAFQFAGTVAAGGAYNVEVASQPTGAVEHCAVHAGSGTAYGDVAGVMVTCLGAVTALYPNSGSNWNDYVANDGAGPLAASDSACTATGAAWSCLHGGEMRVLPLPGVTTCAGIAAEDSLSALQWRCDDSTGTARVMSTGLRPDGRLSALIDWTGPAWRSMEVSVYSRGELYARSPRTVWWSNPLVSANGGGSLASAGSIYVVTADPATNITVAANRVTLVIQPGLRISASGTGGSHIAATGRRYLWLEGKTFSSGMNAGLTWSDVAHSVLDHFSVSHAEGGTGTYDAACISLAGSSGNRLHAVHVAACDGHGLVLDESNGNRLTQIVASNNRRSGISQSSSSDNQWIGILTAANDQDGLAVGSGGSNVFLAVSVINNTAAGLAFLSSDGNSIGMLAGANNNSSLYFGHSSYNNAIDILSSHNRRHSVVVNDGFGAGASIGNYFSGELRIGFNLSRDCLGESPAGGIIDISCSDSGADGSSTYTGQSSDAVLRTGVNQAATYLGKVQEDDAANASDMSGLVDYLATLDWTSFDSELRVWGVDGLPGEAFPHDSHRGPVPSCSARRDIYRTEAECVANANNVQPPPVWQDTGRIWDFRLALGDTGYNGLPAALDVLGLPDGDDYAVHAWSGGGQSVYLRRAVELLGDGAGNENALCESGETCLYTPNFGAYQGHGDIISAGRFFNSAGGGLTNVRLMRHGSNGL